MQENLSLAQHFLRDHDDFMEGVRAAVVDKERNPRWRPATMEEVSAVRVAEYYI